MVFGKKSNTIAENFVNNNSNSETSMNFLLDNSNDSSADEEFKKKMLKYINQDSNINTNTNTNEFYEKNYNRVEPSNTFVSNMNKPNFESNVADISKFYKINYDNLDENELKSTSIDSLKNQNIRHNLEQNQTQNNPQKVSSDIHKQPEEGRQTEQVPNYWDYKNELPMNGGLINGIGGFDSLESQFALYNPNKLNLKEDSDNNYKNIPHNDLRKPVVYED